MSIPPEDYYRQRLTEVKRIGLQWAERARKVYKFLDTHSLLLSHSLSLALLFYIQVATDSGALSLDKVFELIMEGENLPFYLEKEIKVPR